jgi:phosphatidylserine/phosphatidylglycerophosphate/cardiolipin synthase-like enzyme
VLVAVLLLFAGCALSPARQQQVAQRIVEEQAQALDCRPPQACAPSSPMHALLDLDDGRHRVLLLEQGADALRLRLHLLRTARRSIEVQTYILNDGASTELVLAELLAAARRGVRVRLLVDQLFSLDDPDQLAALALAHRNFELRFYNPTFKEARTQAWEFAAGILCCFSRFNQRMHNKLVLVDDAVAIIGGRNYRDSYFDLDPEFAYYDRELMVLGPAVADMRASFEAFWQHRRAVAAAALHDVGRVLLDPADTGPALGEPADTADGVRDRLAALSAQADDPALVAERFVEPVRAVDDLRFVTDAPVKIGSRRPDANAASEAIAALLASAQHEVLMQTPYLVLGRDSLRMFRDKRERQPDLVVRVSTNSLAATDAYPVYALSYKYKKRYLRELGFRIHEFQPAPADIGAMVELAGPVRAPRVSMHAKSLVIDRRTSLVGTHNFDPRSDRFNTESAVIIEDAPFAEQLAASLLRDMERGNSWVIAPVQRGPAPLYALSRMLESISTALPLFDLWPFRYATSWEADPDCPPVEPGQPGFHDCHRDVGDFPEVDSPMRRFLTRLAAAFGAPAVPIL